MKHLKSSSADLRKLFSQAITVRHIAEPFTSFDAGQSTSTVIQFIQERDFDVVGVRERGVITGYVRKDKLQEGIIKDYLEVFRSDEVVDEYTSLLEIFRIFTERNFIFVVTLGQVGGIVTRGDLQKAPVRMWLFGLISLIEMQFLKLIRLYYPNDTWTVKITKDRLSKAECIHKERAKRNEAIDIADCLQFGDKRTIIVKNKEIRSALGFTNREETGKILEDLERLRDNLAHSQDIITGQWPHAAITALKAEEILQKCEEITSQHLHLLA